MRKLCLCISIMVIGFISLSFAKVYIKEKERTIANFALKNVDNKLVNLSDLKKAKGFIIVFTCNKCPMAKMYSERLNSMNSKYKSKGVYLMAINSMDTLAYKEESFKLMQKRAAKEKFNFPYLQDKLQLVARQFNATHTPQAFVVWKDKTGKMVIQYQGSIDDNAAEPAKAHNYLAKAVDELLKNKEVTERRSKEVIISSI